VTHFEKPLTLEHGYAHAAHAAPTIKTLALLAALLAYAAGFVILYPLAASSVAKSVAEGADPTPIQFVAP
jgi:hypothetical protein